MQGTNMQQTVLYEVSEGIATITLNRPTKLNAFNKAMFAELNAAMARFRDDETAYSCIITATQGAAFSAGFDIETGAAMLSRGTDDTSAFEMNFVDDDMNGKPVIFAAFGHCIGQAVALGSCADIRIAADDTIFSLPEAKIGISAALLPGLLSKLLGASQASYALLYGGNLDADWGLRSGFLHEVVSRDRLLPRAREIALAMNAQAPLALGAHKRLMRASMWESRDTVREMGGRFRQQTLQSRDFREGIEAFMEKRKPQFTGR